MLIVVLRFRIPLMAPLILNGCTDTSHCASGIDLLQKLGDIARQHLKGFGPDDVTNVVSGANDACNIPANAPQPAQPPYGASPPPSSQGQFPGQITEAESLYHGTWTLNTPGGYYALWDNAAAAQMTVVRFDSDAIVITRVDTPGSSSAGMTAVYTAQISPDGHSVTNAHVVWSWPGHPGFPTASG